MVKKITDSKWFYILVSLLLAFALWIYVGKEANPLTTGTVRSVQVVFSGLDVLEERGIPRIVASSSPRSMILQNLSTTGAGRYFAQVVCGADVEHSKPAPDIFLLAASRLGVDIRRCLVLEDSLNGLRAARASGAVSVMVPDLRPYGPEVAPYVDYLKQDLSQVIDLLDRVE